MNTNLMAVLSLLVIAALVVVLVSFVQKITQILTHTADILDTGKTVAYGIRRDCEHIVDGVVTLNGNLNGAAAGLISVAGAAQQRALSLATYRAPQHAATVPASAPAAAPEPEPAAAAAAAAEERSAWVSTPRGRFATAAPVAPAEPEPAQDEWPFRAPSS
jgi:uncharacterized protein YoxC